MSTASLPVNRTPGFEFGLSASHRRDPSTSDRAESKLPPLQATRRGKVLGWGAGVLIATGGLVGGALALRSDAGRYNSALTQHLQVIGAEIATGKIDPNAVTYYKVPTTEDAYSVASDIEGHPVAASDPVISEAAIQAGGGSLNNEVPKGTRLIIQRDVFPTQPPSLAEQSKHGQL